jgi:hypothetical protein
VANHGQYVGSPTLGGSAGVTFNGTSQYVTVPAHASLDLGDQWVLWCYIKRGATGANRTLMSKGAGGYQLRLDATGKPQVVRSGGTVLLTAPTALDTNAHTVAVRKDGVFVGLYVDGGQVASSGSAPDTTTNTTWPLRLGADTNSSGTAVEFFNGTMMAAAVFPAPLPGQVWGPVILPQLSGLNLLDVPLIRTAYRDPADSTTALVTAPIPVLVLPALGQVSGLTQYTLVASGNLTPDSAGQASIPGQNMAPGQNGANVPLAITSYDAGSQPLTAYQATVQVDVALARLVPNITLGDNVASLADSWAMNPAPAAGVADGGGLFYRAMTGPGPTDFAPGSAWSSTAAGVQAQLPARGAYLAAQAQIVRRT